MRSKVPKRKKLLHQEKDEFMNLSLAKSRISRVSPFLEMEQLSVKVFELLLHPGISQVVWFVIGDLHHNQTLQSGPNAWIPRYLI